MEMLYTTVYCRNGSQCKKRLFYALFNTPSKTNQRINNVHRSSHTAPQTVGFT